MIQLRGSPRSSYATCREIEFFSRGKLNQLAVCESRAAITKILLKRNEMQCSQTNESFPLEQSPSDILWRVKSFLGARINSGNDCYVNTNRRVVDIYGAWLMDRKCYVIKLDFRKLMFVYVWWAYISTKSRRSMPRSSW